MWSKKKGTQVKCLVTCWGSVNFSFLPSAEVMGLKIGWDFTSCNNINQSPSMETDNTCWRFVSDIKVMWSLRVIWKKRYHPTDCQSWPDRWLDKWVSFSTPLYTVLISLCMRMTFSQRRVTLWLRVLQGERESLIRRNKLCFSILFS